MANVKNGLVNRNVQIQAQQGEALSLKGVLATQKCKSRFEELLGKKAAGFMSSLLSVTNNNKLLAAADPWTIVTAGAIAAALDLPINPSLGFAYIVPYGGKAQFQMGYKGYIQLAMRSGQYKTINACEVYEGEIKSVNRFTGEMEFGEKTSDKVIGYLAYFKLVNGFEKYKYMSLEEMVAHAKKYSKNYKGGTKTWGITDFNSMAIKTVLKLLISKYGILSIDMQGMATAIANDGGVIKEDEDGNLHADFEGETIEAEAQDVQPEEAEVVVAKNATTTQEEMEEEEIPFDIPHDFPQEE